MGNFQANVRYGFSARALLPSSQLALPNLPTTGSPDAFFLFCGSGQLAGPAAAIQPSTGVPPDGSALAGSVRMP
ncbi:hypothetical protein AK812_SmicGene16605 [Symbiodinium microadriaticum]|uniref:Uncharacterized protein n=1 Tax=Symbiodinium microadriaticum TaxID=2951 RepID=A0A1Q9DZZ9_SYMMI|nr:hypothetical protein AK812_SmicGene16605 [Symbiodinium microadriaticum]